MIPPKVDDKTGRKFGRLTVVELLRTQRHAVWRCLCECGREVAVAAGSLTSGHTRSCGCLKIERLVSRAYRHGHARSRTYNIWYHMHRRCSNRSDIGYADYGGRGIAVCDEWRDYEVFLAQMGECPVDHTIERIDNDCGYSLENCRWATCKEQARNRRSNVVLVARGKSMTMAAWAEKVGINKQTISERIKRGWSHERAIFEPVRETSGVS